ncbi:MAG: hypothetical protein HWN65_09090 [Candidatus Helarchaeota archaeon]|nr:hypothetical protein [Candidatus Helarchaeota archaeon]
MDEKALKKLMDEKKYNEVFSQLKDHIQENPTDKGAKKLFDKFQNDYKKREQKEVIASVDSKIGFHLYDEALPLIEEYLGFIPDDKKALQLKEKIIQEKVKYEIDSGYKGAKEQYDLQNYSEALKILNPLVKQYKNEQKLLKLKEQVEKDKWQAQYNKWESEARQSLQNEQFDEALKKAEMILKRESSNKTILKLREKILDEQKKTKKKKLWDEINTQIKIENFSIAVKCIKELLEIDPNDSKASKLQSTIIEKETKNLLKNVVELAKAELKAYKFADAIQALEVLSDDLQSDQEVMSLKEKIMAEEKKFLLSNLISTAKKLIKDKKYEAALERIDEALKISDNMSKEAIALKTDIQKKTRKDKIEKFFEILPVYQKNKSYEEALDVVNQILELDPEHSKALKLKSSFEKELGRVPEAVEKPAKVPAEEKAPSTPGEVQVLREYDYIGGDIRFKVAIRNYTETAITNLTVVLNITEQYTIESLTKQVPYLAPGETRGVDFKLTPMACGQSKVFGSVTYSDAFGEPHSVTVKPKTISIKCPLVVPEDSSRKEIDKWLKSQLKSTCSVELGNIPREQGFKIANAQIAALDLHNVLMEEKKLLSEFLGVAKVTQNKILVRATALEDKIQMDVFTDDMKSATGILAYIRNLVQIAMKVQADLQIKEEKIGIQILDAFEIIGRLTKLCDLCQIRGAVKDGVLILNELAGQIESSYLKGELFAVITNWKEKFEKQKGEQCSEEMANNLEYYAINWIKIAHKITQSKYGVYKETFDSSSSSASKNLEERINSIADEIHALENAYLNTILKYLMIIHKENGLVLYTQGFGSMEFDSDLVGGFLTAIQSFGVEISQKETPVTKLAYKDFELELKDGDFVRTAIVLAGKGTDLIRERLSSFMTDFEKKFKSTLKKWDGNIDAFQKLQPKVNKAFNIEVAE